MPAFRPEGFREVAEKLRLGGAIASSEARNRTIAGRCYYASYLAVSDAMYRHHSVQPSKFEYPNHYDLGQHLAKMQHDDEIKRIGDALVSLLARRKHADYELTRELPEDDADDSVADAQRVAKLLTPDLVKRIPILTGKPK